MSRARFACVALAGGASLLALDAEVGVLYSQEKSAYGLEEIVVSARRREERLIDAPVSVSAFSAADVVERGIQTVADVTHFVPNVQFDSVASESGGGASSQIAIRGIGQTDYVLTVEPAVGVYLDGVYVGRSVGSLIDAVDVSRIEVLRGPQGTLFGKNTIAGAIQLISERPSPEFTGYAEATAGRYDRLDFRGAISGPVTDAIRLRLSAANFQRDGHVKRVTYDGRDTGERQGSIDRQFGRLVGEFDLSENFMATVSLDGTRVREESPGHILLAQYEINSAAGHNAGVPGGVCLPDAGPSRLTNPFCMNSGYTRDLKDLENTNSGVNHSNADIWGAALTLAWTLGDHEIRSITAYRDVEVDVAQQMQGNPFALDLLGQDITYEQLSQELQANGSILSSRLHYTAGLYYQRDRGRQEFDVSLSHFQFMSGGEIKDRDYAAYGQLTYDATDALSLTGGLRYTKTRRQFNPGLQHLIGYETTSETPIPGFVNIFDGIFGPVGAPLFPAGWYKRSSNSLTWQASASYRFQPDLVGYATVSKGFKGGGFAMRYFPPVDPGNLDPDDIIGYAGPEKAITYELGVKSELMDRRLRLNLAAFYTDYKDIQITVNIDPGGGALGRFVPTLLNAGTATIKGFEAESSFLAAKWLRLDGTLGYVDAEYDSFAPVVLDNYPNADSIAFANTPEWTANFGGTLTLYEGDAGRFEARGDYSYRSGQFKEFTNEPSLYQKGYHLVNTSVSYYSPDENWSVQAGVTNLTNTLYIVSGRFSDGGGYGQAVVSRPREWFARLRYQF